MKPNSIWCQATRRKVDPANTIPFANLDGHSVSETRAYPWLMAHSLKTASHRRNAALSGIARGPHSSIHNC